MNVVISGIIDMMEVLNLSCGAGYGLSHYRQ